VIICNEVDNLVDEPGVTGHKSELMMRPRFTHDVAGLFACRCGQGTSFPSQRRALLS
jgi:hypothetical protein